MRQEDGDHCVTEINTSGDSLPHSQPAGIRSHRRPPRSAVSLHYLPSFQH